MMSNISKADKGSTKKRILQIKTKTWNRDSHGLFDYENEVVKSIALNIQNNGVIGRKKHDVVFINSISNIPNEEMQELMKISLKNNKYSLVNEVQSNLDINNKNLTDLQEKIWRVVRCSNESKIPNKNYISNFKYILKKNDIIKLGRIKFKINDINIVDKEVESNQLIFKPHFDAQYIENKEGFNCRICLFQNQDENNPLLSLCKCKGSVNFVHLECLKYWISHKMTSKEINNKMGVSYIVKAFNCEICKEPYPALIKYKDQFHNLINYFVPEGQNYVILESLNSIKENQYPLAIHVLMFMENESYFLGRGHSSDVRISDISVSRTHTKISFCNNEFIMEDCGSKFGTLVLVKNPLEISEGNEILQVGRSLINAYLTDLEKINKKESKDKLSLESNEINPNELLELDEKIKNFNLEPKSNEDFDY